MHGTRGGEYLGLPPAGRVRYVSREFYRVADGLITEEWICSDTRKPAPADPATTAGKM
jgi:predicted ester cyclase